jgi:hypothetical protein
VRDCFRSFLLVRWIDSTTIEQELNLGFVEAPDNAPAPDLFHIQHSVLILILQDIRSLQDP